MLIKTKKNYIWPNQINMNFKFLTVFFLLISISIFSQKPSYSILNIPDSLKQNANAVVRLSEMNINIPSQKSMEIKMVLVTTVLNKIGFDDVDLMEYYDKNRKISNISVTIYDAFGNETKTYKKRDFKDRSVADGVSIFNDNRAISLDYTPINYPFTIAIETEIETSNTAFIPSWSPSDGYLVSTEKSVYSIDCNPSLKLKTKEVHFSKEFPIQKTEIGNKVTYVAQNLAAKKREELSPGFYEFFPVVYFGLENFHLENVDGYAENWSEFGKWYYNSLLADTEEIPEETKIKIKNLIGTEKDPIEIARIVYQYVQEKTRYVSVQIGIGGWKPMLAKDVDKLGYGDCKALTNYTRSLLKSVDVPSYFTVVYAGSNKKSIRNDIASIQGNHAILGIPTANEMVWLECTSQTHPFGFQGDFTDDRAVLVIKPEGGEIIKTKEFKEVDNLKSIKGNYSISVDGDFTGTVKIISKGLMYDNEFGKERMSYDDQVKNYKNEFNNINNLTIKKINLSNDSKKIEFIEDLELQAEGYAQNSGGKYMFTINAFDQNSYVPKRYKTREFPFEISRGYTYEDEIQVNIPEGFIIEAKPNGIEQENEFGYYKIQFTAENDNVIICKRKLIIKKGFYDKSKYEDYRKFRETIARNDNSKILIAKA